MCRFMVEDLDIVGVDVGEGSDFTNYILSNIKTVKYVKLHHIEYKVL